mgnify:CR=1 FL=1
MGIDHNKRLKEHLYYYSARISRDMSNLIKWLVLAVITGCIVGAASTLFSFTLKAVTGYRKAHEWIFLLLPLSGLVIVFLYEKLGKEDGGTNQVLSTVRSRDNVPILSAPLIFITTALTHLTGGSAGREGAAIQLGGSIANQLGRWIHLDEEDRHVIVMCGMSAAFSALFGTPMAAAVFALEVVSVGVMYYAALMPCMIASLVASGFAAGMGVTPESFHVTDIPALTVETGLKMGVIALGCAIVSIMFCIALNGAAGLYGRWFKNKYVRVAVGACLVIVVPFILSCYHAPFAAFCSFSLPRTIAATANMIKATKIQQKILLKKMLGFPLEIRRALRKFVSVIPPRTIPRRIGTAGRSSFLRIHARTANTRAIPTSK